MWYRERGLLFETPLADQIPVWLGWIIPEQVTNFSVSHVFMSVNKDNDFNLLCGRLSTEEIDFMKHGYYHSHLLSNWCAALDKNDFICVWTWEKVLKIFDSQLFQISTSKPCLDHWMWTLLSMKPRRKKKTNKQTKTSPQFKSKCFSKPS